jgi:pyruvate dehydrogenase E1 component
LDYTRDTDPTETKEWLDSLEGVIEVDGPEVITQGVGRRGWREAERSAGAPPLRGTLEADSLPSWDAPISNA